MIPNIMARLTLNIALLIADGVVVLIVIGSDEWTGDGINSIRISRGIVILVRIA